MRVRQYALVLMGSVLIALLGIGSASAAEQPPYFASFGPDGTGSTGFGHAGPIAVDQQAGLVYVIDHSNNSLLRFDTEGSPVDFSGAAPSISGNEISGLSFFAGTGESQVAVDSSSHNFYVTSGNAVRAFEENGEPYKFTAGPGAGSSEISDFSELLGVAVDTNGDIYAADFAGFVKIYTPSGEKIAQFEASAAANIAVSSTGVVYVNRWHSTVTGFTPSEFPVTATTTYAEASQALDSNASYTVAVDPATDDIYIARDITNPGIDWYDENGTLLATFAGPGEDGEVLVSEGIAINGGDGRIFVSNAPASGLSQVEIFWEEIYEGVPRVESISTSNVTADSAGLRAQINPGSAETTYRFEYGLGDCSSSPCTSIPATGAKIGNGHKGIIVSQILTGLQANTTYHYRVVAENEHGDNLAQEEDHTFTTQPHALGFQLSDSRTWEMVSPPNKHGAELGGSRSGQVQAASNGSSLIYLSRGSIESDPEGNRAAEPSTVFAHRATAGWHSKDITLPNDRVTEIPLGHQAEYKLFSQDNSLGLVEPRSTTQLSSEASERAPYLRQQTEPPVYTPLVTEGNVPPGTEFGGDPNLPTGAVKVEGATSDLHHVVLSSEVPLVEEAPPAPADSLYLWTAGQLQPISVLPVTEGGTMTDTHTIGSGPHTVDHAISDDGSRVFWSAGGFSALYLRDTESKETVRLDVVQPGASGAGKPEPIFQGASADGTVVVFTDSQQLTENASPSGRDLYRCEIPAGTAGVGCSSLLDIGAPIEGSGESTEVLGLVSGVADDASKIYFVANAILEGAPNGSGKSAIAGQPNLYLWREGNGVQFIATLSKEDKNDWGGGLAVASGLSAAASPSGRYLSFMSQSSLTGMDNLDAETGEPVEQVYRYDSETEQLNCLSCNATGAAPNGEVVGERQLVDPRSQWMGARVAAILPQPTLFEVIGVSLYSPRAVLDSGRVFFNAIDALVSADSNDEWDIYQYEPTGIGDCTQSSGDAATSVTTGGCISVLSSGTGEEEAGFLDASESGDDVFFLTSAKLSPLDGDLELDVYDARVGGVSSTSAPQNQCFGEACQSLLAAPSDPAPTSSMFEGPGNAKHVHKRCRKVKRKVRRHGKAVCIHRKHEGHHKRSGHSRRAAR